MLVLVFGRKFWSLYNELHKLSCLRCRGDRKIKIASLGCNFFRTVGIISKFIMFVGKSLLKWLS